MRRFLNIRTVVETLDTLFSVFDVDIVEGRGSGRWTQTPTGMLVGGISNALRRMIVAEMRTGHRLQDHRFIAASEYREECKSTRNVRLVFTFNLVFENHFHRASWFLQHVAEV
jgi:hypothetical protein